MGCVPRNVRRRSNGGTFMNHRLIILNTCWLAGVVWAVVAGHAKFVLTHDISGLSYVIVALMAATLLATALGRTAVLPHAKIWFVMIGLIGNVVGFIIALQGMSSGALNDASALLKMAEALLEGMSVAFCSTLVGAIAALWTSTNMWVLGHEASE